MKCVGLSLVDGSSLSICWRWVFKYNLGVIDDGALMKSKFLQALPMSRPTKDNPCFLLKFVSIRHLG